jgi:hypothetical protein
LDQALLVTNGQKLVALMDGSDLKPRAALWVHNTDTDTWRLWVVPAKQMNDQREFYRRLSELVNLHRPELAGLDASDVELVKGDHPAIKGLQGFLHADGLNSIQISSNLLNGFYLPDGIVLRLAS